MKRALDIVGAVVAIMITAPVMAVVAVVVRVKLGRPVLFRQVRPGLHGEPFELCKFRTMKHAIDNNGLPLSDAERITPLGSFLRATSLDELPELMNVLRGEMSLVGPRPLLTAYLPRYSERQRKRHDVRPGITGWAQVNGRNAIPWSDKLEMDVWYVENKSLVLDMKILVLTAWKVLKRDGISADGQATTTEFVGEDLQ